MNWKTRQMFSDQEHGIVSGLSPVNMTGGGNVPYPRGYKHGGLFGRRKGRKAEYTPSQALLATPAQAGAMAGAMAGAAEVPEELSIEQQVAALAAQQGISVPEARAMILNQMIQERGVTLPDEVINQFATGVITLQDALSQAVNVGSGEEASYEAPSWKEIWERDISNPAYDNNPVTDKLRYPLSAVSTPVQKGLLETFELLGIDPENAPKMQTGGLALDLFERGDQDINEVLNTSVDRMSGSVNPPLSDVGPTEKVEETVTVTEDQGPTDVSALKEAFQQLAVQAVQAANDAVEQGAPIEQVQGPLQERLMMIDEQYRQKSGTQDTILTEEFLIQLGSLTDISAEPIAMQDGGSVPSLPPINDLDRARYELDQAEKALAAHKAKRKPSGTQGFSYDKITKRLEAAVQTLREKVRLLQGDAENVTGTSTDSTGTTGTETGTGTKGTKGTDTDTGGIATGIKTPTVDELTTQGFWEEMKANANRAKLGTLMSGKSKQGGSAGMMDIVGQAQLAEAEALGDVQESMLAQLGASERTAAQLGKPPSSTWGERDWAAGSPIELEKAYRDIATKDGTPTADKFFIGKEIQPPPNIYPTLGTIDYNVIVVVNGKPMTFKEFYMLKRRERITDLIAIKREFDGLGPKKIYGSPQEAQEAGLKSGDQFYGPDGTLYEIP